MLRRKILSLSNLSLFESKTIFSRKIISERKKDYCHGFMPGDFQVICGSMVGENRRSPASTETPGTYTNVSTPIIYSSCGAPNEFIFFLI